MRYVCLFVLIPAALCAQNGATIYKERCASCHDVPAPRVPPLRAIKAMSGKAIYSALTIGPMKNQAQDLSTAQIFALIGYIGPTGGSEAAAPNFTPACKAESTFRAGAGTHQWNGWSPSVTNSRFQDAASAGLTPSDVPKLKLKWAFNLGDVTEARSQPAIVGGRIFIGSMTGALYALDTDSGCARWAFRAASGIRGGVSIGESKGAAAVFF